MCSQKVNVISKDVTDFTKGHLFKKSRLLLKRTGQVSGFHFAHELLRDQQEVAGCSRASCVVSQRGMRHRRHTRHTHRPVPSCVTPRWILFRWAKLICTGVARSPLYYQVIYYLHSGEGAACYKKT